MKKLNKIIITLLTGLIIYCPLTHPEPQSNNNLESEYQKLVTQLKQSSIEDLENFDYFNFRKIVFQSGHIQEFIDDNLKKQYHSALDIKDYSAVLNVCEKVLSEDYTNAKFHTMKAYSLHKLNQKKEEQNHHIAVSFGLNQSILATGDGRSINTAWHVFTVREEYDLLKQIGFLKVIKQELTSEGGKPFDILEAEDENGNIEKFYFDISDVSSMNLKKK